MIIHPNFDPVAVHLGPLSIRWYGLMYLVGFILFLILGRQRIRRDATANWDVKQLDDLLFYGVLGVILGGRIGYVLFYKFGDYLSNPLAIFKVWEGGMSFHGGFLGVLVAMTLFARKYRKHYFDVADFVAPLVPLGLAAGRIGNFINGELYGRVTHADAPWAMLFPSARADDIAYAASHPEWQSVLAQFGGLPRHASQLYQFALEGMLLFFVLWFYSKQRRRTGRVSAVFLLGYGLCRFVAEFAREPDSFLGYLALNLSMGQWLSLPMIVLGGWLFYATRPHGNYYR